MKFEEIELEVGVTLSWRLQDRSLVCSREWLGTGVLPFISSWSLKNVKCAACKHTANTKGACQNSSARQIPGETLRREPSHKHFFWTDHLNFLLIIDALCEALHYPGLLRSLLINVRNAEWRHHSAGA